MISKLERCVTIIPTISEISEGQSVERYLSQMEEENCWMPICVVDDSNPSVHRANREHLKSIKGHFKQDATIYHFGPSDQGVFYERLMEEGVKGIYIEMLKTVPSYGAARNKCFLVAKIVGADSIFFFDDDTRPACSIFRRHLKILGSKRQSKEIGLVSGPYIGARGIDFSFLRNREDKMKFLEAIGHHGESSLSFLRSGGVPVKPPSEDADIRLDQLEVVRNIRGGNMLIGSVYKSIVCPTIRQAPGIDDTFVSHQVYEKGFISVKSPVPVVHEHLAHRREEESIVRYLESWAKPLAFELLHRDSGTEDVRERVLRYARDLSAIDHRSCKLVGKRFMDNVFLDSFVEEIFRGLENYRRLLDVWAHIMEICDSFRMDPV